MSREDELLSSCKNMLVISSTFLPPGQPGNTELGGHDCCCKNKNVEFALSFQFSIIRELKMELLCLLNILMRELGLEKQNVFIPKFSRMKANAIKL